MVSSSTILVWNEVTIHDTTQGSICKKWYIKVSTEKRMDGNRLLAAEAVMDLNHVFLLQRNFPK